MKSSVQSSAVSLAFNRLLLSTGGELAWSTCGVGRPVLMLNGGPGSPSLYMHNLVARLSSIGQMIIFDQPGTGNSKVTELSPATVGMGAIISAAEELREYLGLESWHVFGHSFGTMLGAQYAAQHPERVLSLVLSGPGGPDTSFFQYFRDNVRVRLTFAERKRFDALLARSKQGVISSDEESELDELFMKASTFNPELIETHQEHPDARINRTTSEVVWAAMHDENWDIKPKLRNIKCPTLIVVGRQDYIGEAAPILLASMIPNARISWFDQCGHKPWFEYPDRFDLELADFYRLQTAKDAALEADL